MILGKAVGGGYCGYYQYLDGLSSLFGHVIEATKVLINTAITHHFQNKVNILQTYKSVIRNSNHG